MLVTAPVRIPCRAGQRSKSTNLPEGLFCASCPVARLDVSECGREEDASLQRFRPHTGTSAQPDHGSLANTPAQVCDGEYLQ